MAAPCHPDPTEKDPRHRSCAPKEYVSPIVWDGADNLLFRPLSELWTFRHSSEAANATSLDEVADSAWFTNRLGAHPLSPEELTRAACQPEDLLDPEGASDGSWVVDRGKMDGSSKGFRVNIGGRKYMLKVDDVPEHPSAASTIGAAAYNAVGFYTSCEQIVYFRPSVLSIKPGLKYKGNFSEERPFDQAVLDSIVGLAPRRGGLVRFQASKWLPGKTLGPFTYAGTRADDRNDIIPHQDRRELRGGRLLAAWIDHFDAREQNTMNVWLSDRADAPDSSPGHIVHYYLDTSDCLGSMWAWEQITRRLGYSYVVDWSDVGRDFFTLGIPRRPWDTVTKTRGHEQFQYFDVEHFVPEDWKNEYANPAFERMTERDAAWMARILARFTPPMVRALAEMARFSRPDETDYLTGVLEGRLEKILERYLLRLAPLADVTFAGDELCATDLAEQRALRPVEAFRYTVRSVPGGWLQARRRAGGVVCSTVPHVDVAPGAPDDDPSRYVKLVIRDGVARGALVAHAYDLGPGRGFVLVGLERPEGDDEP
ncbi:MAG TPA: hypothetical protein VGI39_17175 [Polyangiaceae bacterium]